MKLLEGQKVIDKWQLLEDLAIKERPTSDAYKHVLSMKGKEEVQIRQQFLHFQNK